MLTQFAQYFFELLAERRRVPGTDHALSLLAQVEDGGTTLSEGELLSTSILLLVAGHETTGQPDRRWRGSPLLEHPDQWARF